MKKVNYRIQMTAELDDWLYNTAQQEGATKAEIVRRALSVVKVYQEQREQGRKHLGFVADASQLDAEIVGILNH